MPGLEYAIGRTGKEASGRGQAGGGGSSGGVVFAWCSVTMKPRGGWMEKSLEGNGKRGARKTASRAIIGT